jgi:hypothetical protein
VRVETKASRPAAETEAPYSSPALAAMRFDGPVGSWKTRIVLRPSTRAV